MYSAFTWRSSFFLFWLLAGKISLFAQQPIPTPASADTIRIIEIIRGNSLREKTVDSVVIETISGNVILKEGLTTFNCDSALINRHTNTMEAFGNIHINQNDSIHTYAQYLRYIGADRVAFLKKDVRLTDKKGTLLTQELEYNLKTSIGKYRNGGQVINGTTTLTSNDGIYYADTKDVYFKNNVHLVDPKYNIRSDSLLYNTQTQVATFISATWIKSKNGGDVYTTNGTYNLKTGKAFFGNRTVIKDSSSTVIVADNIAIDDSSGIAQLEGNAVVKDSVNGYTVTGGQVYHNKKTGSFLATRKPVLIFKGEGKDSTFIAADTLYSGITKKDSSGKKSAAKNDTLKKTMVISGVDSLFSVIINKDSAHKNIMPKKDSMQRIASGHSASDTAIRYFEAFHHVRIYNDSLQAVCDSLFYSAEDSVFRLYQQPLLFSNNSQVSGDTIHLYIKNKKADRIYVFDNGMIINKANEQMYNQISGRTLNGYFKEGALDYMRVKGSPAESIFYPQDDDSAYSGMNRSKSDVIDIYFVSKEINKVKFVNDVDGTLYPIRQVPEEQKYLKNFKWWESRRPKNKLELFE